MKTSLKLFAISLLTLLCVVSTNVTKSQVSASISFSVFHDNLQAYGRWVSHPRYGQVWIPSVSKFRPYSTGGHWAYTDFGWTWVSDYDWGWAAFHYGRWAFDQTYGWVWVPGYEWGPAWVSWRTGGDYYGWAPLSPDVSIGVDVSFGTAIPADQWVFVPSHYITSPVVYRYYVPPARNVTIIRNTTVINNVHETNVFNQKTVVVAGPRKEEVERVAHTKVQVMHVNDAAKPTREVVDRSRNTINVYRPVINKTTVNKNVTINNTTTNKNTTNNTRVNKNTTVTNNKEVNKTNKTTVNNNKNVTTNNKNVTTNDVVNNNKVVNGNKAKEGSKPTTHNQTDKNAVNNQTDKSKNASGSEAGNNRTASKKANGTLNEETAKKPSNHQPNDKTVSSGHAQKMAPADTGRQNAVRPSEKKQSENNGMAEKKPAQKPGEQKARNYSGSNDSNKSKRPEDVVKKPKHEPQE